MKWNEYLLKSPTIKTGAAVFTASNRARVSKSDAATLRALSEWWSRCVLNSVNVWLRLETNRNCATVQRRWHPAPGYLDGLKGASLKSCLHSIPANDEIGQTYESQKLSFEINWSLDLIEEGSVKKREVSFKWGDECTFYRKSGRILPLWLHRHDRRRPVK